MVLMLLKDCLMAIPISPPCHPGISLHYSTASPHHPGHQFSLTVNHCHTRPTWTIIQSCDVDDDWETILTELSSVVDEESIQSVTPSPVTQQLIQSVELFSHSLGHT